MKHTPNFCALLVGLALMLSSCAVNVGSSRATIEDQVNEGMAILVQNNPAAREMAKSAKAILVIPKIVKAGFLLGGQFGEGAMRQGEDTIGYYSIASASYGLQAGATQYGIAMFFMDDASLDYLSKSKGWEIGVGPMVVVADDGFMQSYSSTTLQKGVYVFFFDKKGLMAGLGIQGSKITRIRPR